MFSVNDEVNSALRLIGAGAKQHMILSISHTYSLRKKTESLIKYLLVSNKL